MTELTPYETALSLIEEYRPTPGTETIHIANAAGRCLAEAVQANVAKPPSDLSAMDGYAVRLSDVRDAGTELSIIGEAPAGKPFSGLLKAGQAVRIFTGGELPGGADHIVIQEDVERSGERITCRLAYSEAKHIRRRAIDFDVGDALLSPGTIMGAAQLSLTCSANVPNVKVFQKLRVGILANGNELKTVGSSLAPGEIISSNSIGIAALVGQWGGEAIELGIVEDSTEAIKNQIAKNKDIDLFVSIGGASVGEYDFMRTAFEALTFKHIFQKVAVRPGKPTWFAKSDKQFVLGLPGNPASAFVCAYLFLKPLVTGQPNQIAQAVLSEEIGPTKNRDYFLRARLSPTKDGQLFVTPKNSRDSSLMTPLAAANALIHRPAHAPAASPGLLVNVIPTTFDF